jgi:hypothetical protein
VRQGNVDPVVVQDLLDPCRMPNDDEIMEPFSPEFADYWIAGQPGGGDEPSAARRGDESPSASQQEALRALAERVNAARSIL